MLSLTIWVLGIALEAMLLYRGVRAGLVSRYPNFYIYASSLFLSDSFLYLTYLWKPTLYDKWSWYTGFLSLFLGCGILLEIFRHVFSEYAGAEKFARVCGFAMLGAVICFAVIYPLVAPSSAVARSLYVRLQRDFVAVQAFLLLGLLQIISYYGLSMARNLRGMIVGYGQALGVTLIALALRSYIGPQFQSTWVYVQPLSYLTALVVWLVALWSYRPNPKPKSRIGPDGDYDGLASRTREMVSAASSELVKVERL
jgi:hypothetical protein